MESLMNNPEIVIPLSQIIILLVVSTVFVLLSRFKSALIANFLFIFFWMYQNNKVSVQAVSVDNIVHLTGNYTLITGSIIFGIAMLILYEIFE